MRSSSKNYYTLVVRENDQWSPEFGDFNKEVVNDEMDDSYGEYKKKNLKIICTAESQEQIDTEVRNLNLAIESDKEAYRNELRDELLEVLKAYNQYSNKMSKLSKKLPQFTYEAINSRMNGVNLVFDEARNGINKLKL